MLSYRHAFHAGNHADVLKHTVLSRLVLYLTRKDKPFSFIDTHAGAGLYRLDGDQSLKTGEAETGIRALLRREDAPELLAPYVDLCRNLAEHSFQYPGSPEVVRALSRPGDTLQLMELHPAEIGCLRDNMGGEPRIHVHHRDGYSGLLALCPPEPRRGVALMDPSYETDDDFRQAPETLLAAHRKWPVGILALWYPLVGRRNAEIAAMKDRFYVSGIPGVLSAELRVSAPPDAGPGTGESWGLYGSGMLIIQPPWTLAAELSSVLPWLADALGRDNSAGWDLEWINEPR